MDKELADACQRIEELEKQLVSTTRFYNLLDASPVPMALNDEQKNITYLNKAFTRAFGYQLDDISSLQDWWLAAYPDEDYRQQVISTWEERLHKSKESGAYFEPIEFTIRTRDGSERTVMVNAASLEGEYEGNHLVILYDISERKNIEKSIQDKEIQLQEIIDHLPSMIFLKEASDLRYAYINKVFEEWTGVTREQVIGRNDYEFWPREQAEFFISRDRKVLESGILEDIPDEPIDTPSGTRSLHTRKVAINDEKGNPKYLLGISDDITEQKVMRAESERMQRELQQAHKMESLGHLAGGIAHDFNNLLAIISGYASLAHEKSVKGSDEKITHFLERVLQASERATSLVAQMLSFSRNEPSFDEPVNLAELVNDDLKMLRATLPSTIEIQTDINDSVPLVMMNKTQLNQVLMNLAVNARDAMDGQGTLSIRVGLAKGLNVESTVAHKPVRGDWVEVTVSDTGTGIDPAIMDDIFTPFFTSKDVGEGTGMGLSVVYGIVKAQNGHILVDSETGKGATFRLLFRPTEVELTGEDNMTGKVFPQSPDNNKSILIVDDEQSLLELLNELVTSYGYKAEIFSDSVEALAQFEKDPDRYSMLVTDQTMPKMTGLALIDRVRELRPGFPSVLCSGYSDKINPEDISEKDIVFFTKPVNITGFMHKLTELMGSR